MNIAQQLMSQLMRRPVEVDEMELAARASRGHRANELLKDELLSEAFSKVREVYMQVWENSDPLDTDTRERAWVATKLLSDVQNSLISYVRDGQAAQKQIEKLIVS